MMSPFVRLFVLSFLAWSALGSTSLVPAHLAGLGASQSFIGIFNILNILVTLASVVFLGRRLVRWPRLQALRWGFAVFALSSALSWALADSLAALTVLKLAGSVAQVFTSTMLLSLLLDLSPPGGRAGRIALFSVAGMVTNPLTALAGEAVLRTFGGPGLFVMAGAAALVTAAWTLVLKEPPRHPGEEDSPAFLTVVRRKDLRTLFLLSFIFGTYFSALTTFLPRHTLVTLGEANLSAFLVPFSTVAIVLRMVLGNHLDQHPPRRFLAWSFASVAASLGLLLLPASWFWLGAAGLIYGLGHSVLFPLLNALIVDQGGEAHKAAYSNAFLVVNLLGAVVMTPVLGFLGDHLGFPAIVLVLAASALGALVLVRSRFPKPGSRRPEAGPPSSRSS